MNLSEIIIYPIKSLGGISLNNSVVEDRGLRFDRRCMIVDEYGRFLTQRERPQMATLKTVISEQDLQVQFGNSSIKIPLKLTNNQKMKVEVWRSRCDAFLFDKTINDWFSNALQIKCQLVMMPESTKRNVNPIYAIRKFRDNVSFADGYPVSLICENSLKDLNEKLLVPVSMNRFRPNLVVRDAEPFEEDNWKKIRIGSVIFHIVKPCDRCVITTINQITGVSDVNEPLKTLAKYRLKPSLGGKKILFGQYMIPENFGETIRLNEKVEILEVKKRKFKI